MNRLLRISFNTLLNSLLPVVMWILLSYIVSKDIARIFSITYSFQFIFSLIVAIFGTGPNVTAQKHNNKEIIDSNIILGMIVTLVLVIIFSVNVDAYLRFMNLNPNIYRAYTIYSILLMFLQVIIRMINEKLYFQNENKKANRLTIVFNIINILLIISLSMFIVNKVTAICLTIALDTIIIIYIMIKNIEALSWEFCIKENVKYVSGEIYDSLWMFVIYFVGDRMLYGFGEAFIVADNFSGLISDAQWDMSYAIITAATIDASKDKLHFKSNLKNAFKLVAMLMGSSLIMGALLYHLYKPELWILAIMFGVQIINMFVCPRIWLRNHYIQINYSHKKVSFHMNVYQLIRVVFSFVPTPFCTYLGQFIAMLYDIAVYDIYYNKKFYIDNNGYLKMKKVEEITNN